MARKGQKYKQWTAEEKYKIIEPLLKMERGITTYSRETGINSGLLYAWIKKYRENGMEGLKNKKKPGNPLSKYSKKKYDWTFYLDVFNNEIVGYDVRDSMYGNGVINHREALKNMLNNKIKRGYKDLETIIHTDQGSVYSSVSFNNIFNSYTVTRSMSRAGTPTDNPVIESKNAGLRKKCILILT